MQAYQIPQVRWSCKHCKAEGWYTPGGCLPMPGTKAGDHDRPQGGRCLKSGSAITLADDQIGVVDCLGYLICRDCHVAGHGKAPEAFIHRGSQPHCSERCDFCSELICNEGEP